MNAGSWNNASQFITRPVGPYTGVRNKTVKVLLTCASAASLDLANSACSLEEQIKKTGARPKIKEEPMSDAYAGMSKHEAEFNRA